MDHRWSARKPVDGSVVVECSRVGKVSAIMRDISLGGMLIDTGPVAVPLKSRVIVGFYLVPNDQYSWYRLNATAVRHTEQGTAMIFLDCEGETIRALRAALYGPPVPRNVPPPGQTQGSMAKNAPA
jgi:hypothetical protein